MIDDDHWVQQARLAAGPCPQCTSLDVRPISYGMPDADSYHQLQGIVAFAGCCVPELPWLYLCGTCEARWGSQVS